MEWIKCDQEHIQGLVSERNTYKRLLEQCLVAFNDMPNKPVQQSDPRGENTHSLAWRIEQAFRKHN